MGCFLHGSRLLSDMYRFASQEGKYCVLVFRSALGSAEATMVAPTVEWIH